MEWRSEEAPETRSGGGPAPRRRPRRVMSQEEEDELFGAALDDDTQFDPKPCGMGQQQQDSEAADAYV